MDTDRPESRPDARADAASEDFQREWLNTHGLGEREVELAFRHGLEARDRFADRPFHEVAGWLQQSWDGMATGIAWERVADIVQAGYRP